MTSNADSCGKIARLENRRISPTSSFRSDSRNFLGGEKIPGTFSPKWRVRPRVCSLCEVIGRAIAKEGHLDFFVQKSLTPLQALTTSD